jgi:hypothetical protein
LGPVVKHCDNVVGLAATATRPLLTGDVVWRADAVRAGTAVFVVVVVAKQILLVSHPLADAAKIRIVVEVWGAAAVDVAKGAVVVVAHPIFAVYAAAAAAPWPLILLLGDVDGWADAVRAIDVAKGAIVVVGGGKPVCEDGRVDAGAHVAKMFTHVRSIFCPIFVFVSH